jgi:lysozyme family protein
MIDFDEAVERIFKSEGGYVNNPKDPGGETNFGITWPILRKAIEQNIVPAGTTIRTLTKDQAKAIYKALFWEPLGDLHPAIKFQVFDFGVHSGLDKAIRTLQAACGAPEDGKWGPASAAKASQMDHNDLLLKFVALRLIFLTGLPAWLTFGKGWARRIATNLLRGAEDN